ncbi:MAG: 5-keto-L-gluconate epimerase [Armatimonadota bacterium]|nr:5-keto-L-gluconate epimerase [Armatimonadota bacterium]
MRTSFVISASPTKFSPITYGVDLEKAIRSLAGLGFDGVELHVRDPKEVDLSLIKSVIGDCGLEVSAIGTGLAYVDDGLSFSNPNADIRHSAVQRIKDCIDFASNLNALLIIGLVRGRTTAGVDKAQALAWIKEALGECLAFAEKKNVRIVIEPINRYETDLLNTASETIDFIRQLQSLNIGLLLDSFHMNIEEPSIYESIRTAGNLLAHFHIVDSNRWAPGYGHLDFQQIIASLREIDYQGYLSAEILPLPDSNTAAEKTIQTLRPLLQP